MDERLTLMFRCGSCGESTTPITQVLILPHALRFHWTCIRCQRKCYWDATLEMVESWVSDNKMTREDKQFLHDFHISIEEEDDQTSSET